jgi:hypothetical protein
VDGPNSFKNPQFREDLKTINDQLQTADLGQGYSASQKRPDAGKVTDPAPDNPTAEFHLEQELELACIATGATGAAIALVRGDKIVCHATAGPDAPDVGVYLDPHNGLSGSCIQTRHLQQCNDTETDPRVDPEASRTLGVRSIVVLPLVEGDKLFGIFEVLSTRPFAFGPSDLDTLQALTNRIVRGRSKTWESTATAPKVSEPLASKPDPPVQKTASELKGTLPRPRVRPQVSRRADMVVAALGLLVIAAALLLGTLVGWRLGWQNATLALGARSARHRLMPLPKTGPGAGAVSAVGGLTQSAGTDECGQSLVPSSETRPPSGGLTVCQEGKVIFRLPASAMPATRDLATARHSH